MFSEDIQKFSYDLLFLSFWKIYEAPLQRELKKKT